MVHIMTPNYKVTEQLLQLKAYLRVAAVQAGIEDYQETDNELTLQVRFCTITLVPPIGKGLYTYLVEVWLADSGTPGGSGNDDVSEEKVFTNIASAIAWLVCKIVEHDVLNVIELEDESGTMYGIMNDIKLDFS